MLDDGGTPASEIKTALQPIGLWDARNFVTRGCTDQHAEMHRGASQRLQESRETRTHRGLLRVDAPILSTQIGDSGNYLHIDPSDNAYAAARGVRSRPYRLLLPAHIEADGLLHTHSVAPPLCGGHFTAILMA